MTDRIGQQLGNYRLVRLLGQGGQASVYLGEHLHLKSHAAIKVLRTELSENDVTKFLSEGQTLARLEHPQIMRVRDFAVEQGTPFLVMDYAPGGTLRQHHPHGTCLSLDTVVTYVKQVASALQYAHNCNVIHRDIKPENMLLSAQREVLLSDFGIALFATSPELFSTKEMAGTLPYMAPEQLRGRPCFASDQYSLGIVVYEWLCGVRPFEGPHWQLLNQQASISPPPLREKDPSLPEAVERVVLKALAKDPEQRYVSVQFFAQALERASKARASTLRHDSEVTGRLHAISPAKSQQIFLSSSHADNPFVVRLQTDLQRRGITVCNEPQSSTLGKPDQENLLRQAIRATDVVVLVVSSHTRNSHIVKEYLRIVGLYQRRLVSVWVEGEDLTELLPEAAEKIASIDVIDAREPRYNLALDELVACLDKISSPVGAKALSPALEETTAGEPRNPYKGLRAFTEEDTGDFFGRESLIAELVDGVQERLRSEQPGVSPVRLLAVIGPSGSGKSSVVMAGLLPRLKLCALSGSEEWVYLKPMVPGAHPLEALALTLSPHLPDRSLKSIREDLEDDSARGLHLLATHLIKGAEKKVVLFIDQFEEAFNLTTSKDERERFFDLLLAAITERKGPVLIILTFRADFYDRLMTASELGRMIESHRSAVWPMEVNELRAAVKGPAMLPDVNLTFEGNLVGDLLYEVRGQIGALPLLQFTLNQLFERRKGHLLTQRAYQEIGGVKGALAKHAEKTYLALPSEKHRKLARTLFLRLIDPGITEWDTTRRRATLTETILVNPAQTRLMQKTMDLFVQARLLTTNAREGTETTIEVSHEALIREWPRLVEWLRTARDDIRLQHVISADAATWEERNKPGDRLYRGSQLKEAQAWIKHATPSSCEQTFLHASTRRQRQFWLSIVLAVLLVVLLVCSSIGGTAWWSLHQSPDPTRVTNINDYGTGSLRWAVANAPKGSTITFAPNVLGTIVLSHELTIDKSLKLQGSGEGKVFLKSLGPLGLHIISGVTPVIISQLSFTGGIPQETDIIQVDGSSRLDIDHVTIERGQGNFVLSASAKATVTIANCIIANNRTTAINNNGTAVMNIFNSTISNNFSDRGDAGISNRGTMNIYNSIVSNNTVNIHEDPNTSYHGDGGISNNGTMSIINSAIFGNSSSVAWDYHTSPQSAGGIANIGTMIISNSTIANNTTSSQDGVSGIFEGNAMASSNKMTLLFCTIVSNGPLGITLASDSLSLDPGKPVIPAQIVLQNTIVVSTPIVTNAFSNSFYPYYNKSTVQSQGYNLFESSNASFFDAHGDTVIRDPTSIFVGGSPHLVNNTGSTPTFALLQDPHNPALNMLPRSMCQMKEIYDPKLRIYTDQRGMVRPGQGKQACDIGAYESQG